MWTASGRWKQVNSACVRWLVIHPVVFEKGAHCSTKLDVPHTLFGSLMALTGGHLNVWLEIEAVRKERTTDSK